MNMLVEPNGGHGAEPCSHKIALEWIKTVFQARVPENADTQNGPAKLMALDVTKGWLGSNDAMAKGHEQPGFDENFKNGRPSIAPYADYTGAKSTASFLPTERFAKKWQEYVETGDLK